MWPDVMDEDVESSVPVGASEHLPGAFAGASLSVAWCHLLDAAANYALAQLTLDKVVATKTYPIL